MGALCVIKIELLVFFVLARRGQTLERGLCHVDFVFGNMIGSVLYAALFYLAITNWRTGNGGAIADLLKQAAQKKTLAYMALGPSGWATAVVKAILCNWMVTVGAVLAMVSRSTVGKILAMWLPIMTFFALGFEHSIVNMFVIPVAMLFGAPISIRQWWFWNQLPVTVGNIVSGALLTGLALYLTHSPKRILSIEPAQVTIAGVPEFSVAPADVTEIARANEGEAAR